MRLRQSVCFSFILILAACPTLSIAGTTLRVLAASSLTDVMPQLTKEFRKSHSDVEFQLSFDASSRLARSLEAGAPAELFFSADREWMDFVEKHGQLAPDTRRDLVGNELVAIVPAASNAKPPAKAADLGDARFHKIALAGENVPVAKYARAALEKLGAWTAVEPKVVRADNVRAALAWVAQGEADAGIVYRTDAHNEKRVRVAFVFAAATHPPIVYPAAALKSADASQLAAARAFLDFCASQDAATIWRAQGFKKH
jgi:molybdate transport system substrate-binding protein